VTLQQTSPGRERIDPLAGNGRAHRFYERLGLRFVDRRRFGQDERLVYRLERADYEINTSCKADTFRSA
jgi:hypothetical protein